MADIAQLDTANFDTSIAEATPTLVDFWAEWCAPCRAVAPILAEIAEEKGAALRVVKLNVDENPELSQKLGVMSIPTLILYAGGVEKTRIVGARAKAQLLKEIEPHLG